MRSVVLLATLLLIPLSFCRAGDSRHPVTLRTIATADSAEVHPESVFEVTLTLENVGDTVQQIKIPEAGWDRVWRSSNRHVTWDYWDCGADNDVTIEIPPHRSYVFPKPLKMFVEGSVRQSHITFRMGFKTAAFGKTLWSVPVALEVIP